jgi:hypothetical protein|tara:strand:- start:508 stop:3597 length:3090 start_codon:yes stop_codon:yes gene_type:complete
MAVRIEFLDYQHIQSNLVTWNNNAVPTGWTTEDGVSIQDSVNFGGLDVNCDASSVTTGYFADLQSPCMVLQNNHNYTVRFFIPNVDAGGQPNPSAFVRGDSSCGSGNDNYIASTQTVVNQGHVTINFTFDETQNNNSGDAKFIIAFRGANQVDQTFTIRDVTIVDNTVFDTLDNLNSVVGELDITNNEDFPLAMTFQISDINEITSTSGNYSKTFKVPATKNNNKLLKNIYNPNIKTDTDLYQDKRCRIIVNDLFSLNGIIRVTGVGGLGATPTHYNCVFYGDNLTWANFVSTKDMSQIDWGSDGENLQVNKSNITATWNDTDCNSSTRPFVYPITSYGDFNPDGNHREIQLLNTYYEQHPNTATTSMVGYHGYDDNSNSYETPTPSMDWRPAIFVKTTLEKIFAQAAPEGKSGFKISSTFLDSDIFKRLVWLLPNFKYYNSDLRLQENSFGSKFSGEGLIGSFNFAATTQSPNFGSVTHDVDITAGSDEDFMGAFDNQAFQTSGANSGIFIAPEYGKYRIQIQNFAVFLTTSPTTMGGTVTFEEDEGLRLILSVKTVGHSNFKQILTSDIDVGNIFTSASSSQALFPQNPYNFPNIDQEIWLNKGDQVKLQIKAQLNYLSGGSDTIVAHLFGSSTPTSSTTSSKANGKYTIIFNPYYVEYGQTYNLKDVINPELKQIDYIKGVAHAFNLKMTTDEASRTVFIEPFDTFYKGFGEALNWTYKLDRSQTTEDKKLESTLKRKLIFKYKSDSNDKKVEFRATNYFKGIMDEYPYEEDLPSNFQKGTVVFENNFFAGTFNGHDRDTVGFFGNPPPSSCLWTENVSVNDFYRPEKGYEFMPRLLYWNKYSPTTNVDSSTNGRRAVCQLWANNSEIILPDDSFTTGLSGIYPQATSYNRQDSTIPNLAYGNIYTNDYIDLTGARGITKVNKGLFDTYYKKLFEFIKRNPIIRTCFIDLKLTDIVNLDFRKLVNIDGSYWRISRVIDFNPITNKPTKVELIQWEEIGVFAARVPEYGTFDPNDADPIPDENIQGL